MWEGSETGVWSEKWSCLGRSTPTTKTPLLTREPWGLDVKVLQTHVDSCPNAPTPAAPVMTTGRGTLSADTLHPGTLALP